MSNDNNLLRVDNLKTNFYIKDKKVEAVRGVSFHVNKGDILGIVGESGSGKSVLMKSVMNILPENAKIEDGKVYFNNIDISSMNKKEMKNIKGKEIAMIFQDPMTALNPLKKVGDHLIEVLIRHKGINKKSAKIIALDILKQVGIPMPEKRINQYPHEFSGGMRQRVLIAMALACNPRLLIADEPTTALDVTIQAQILQLLKNLKESNDMSVILITHDLGVVASLCNRVVVMYGGLIMEEGLVDEIFYEAKHPYTKALLNSIPKLEENEKSRLKPIKGSAPSLLNPPKGCPFADRCQFAFKKCFQEMPKYKDFSETHRAMCFLEK
ncbi:MULTISPECIES: ABC transporter ATP-binding protein [unclassified Clostridium]|uniref:ABC transporter ATP-binding protein n=1 Tax=unclassified Clostridium TaxID=2614128 RepID=UPI0025E77CEA|nr:ABC transporter ATP-binding protein [Clostridium sp.]MCI6693238.1 ABC transporter ATP-binding protein [Clostridium sp.]MDY2630855.1 ABC transporter ATP-binding protein [Clostridium sp.]